MYSFRALELLESDESAVNLSNCSFELILDMALGVFSYSRRDFGSSS